MIEKLEFENKEIDIQELPKLENIQFNRVEKKYILVLLSRIIVPGIVFNGVGLFFYFTLVFICNFMNQSFLNLILRYIRCKCKHFLKL